jgi:hypothetical protein
MKLEIQSQNDTEVYASDVGYVCISQPNPWGEGDGLVIFAIHNVDIICQMLQQAKVDAIERRNLHLNQKAQQ